MTLDYDVWCELVAKARWLENRQVYNTKLAIMEAVAEIFSD